MPAAGGPNRPISLQPFGQVPFRAVCGVAALVHSWAMDGALRLASHPEKTLVRPRKDRKHVLMGVKPLGKAATGSRQNTCVVDDFCPRYFAFRKL